jgi:hypothetical protein
LAYFSFGTAVAGVAYAVGGPFERDDSQLYRIDNFGTNPTAVIIGGTGVFSMNDIAIDPFSGLAYGVGQTNFGAGLFSIDLDSGVAAEVGPSPLTMNALDFTSDGVLYTWGSNPQDSQLYRYSGDFSQVTPVFDIEASSAGDLAYDVSQPGVVFYGATLPGNLLRIDVDAQTVTTVGFMGGSILGLDFDDDGTLYALQGSTFSTLASMFTVDKATGALTPIGLVDGADGVTGAFGLSIATTVIPVPAALPLLCSALAGLGFVGHRRRKR